MNIYEILEPLIVITVIAAPIYLARPLVHALAEKIRRDRNIGARLDALEAECEATRSLEADRAREREHLRAQLEFMQQLLTSKTGESAPDAVKSFPPDRR
jgi:hypothetical protein